MTYSIVGLLAFWMTLASTAVGLERSGQQSDLWPGAGGTALGVCAGVQATIVGTEEGEELVGTSGPDVIWGGGGGDEIFGLGGDDLICGGDGSDEVSDGEGVDTVYGGEGNDELGVFGGGSADGGPGNDFLLAAVPWTGDPGSLSGGPGTDWVSFLGATESGVTVDVPAGIVGGAANYALIGVESFDLTRQPDVFRGGPGPEWIGSTSSGDDIAMGAGDDRIQLTSSPDSRPQIRMGAGDDHVIAAGRGDVWLGAGNDRARFGTALRVFAGPGEDLIEPVGAGGVEWTARGDSGEDTLSFRYWRRTVVLDIRAGTATLDGHPHPIGGFEIYNGGSSADVLLGGDGPDRIRGLEGADQLRGRAGNDVLMGGPGNDQIRGERGFDICSRGNTAGCERLV